MNLRNIRSFLCVIGGFLIHFSLGYIYSFGNISPYIASYMRISCGIKDINNGNMVWIFAFAIAFQGVTMSFGGFLDKKIGSRVTTLIGCLLMSFSVMATYFTVKINIYSIIMTYGVFFGMGIGIAYSVALSATIKWFPNNRGLIIGIVVSGFGLGSLAFNQIQTFYINPRNVSPNITIGSDKYFSDLEVLNNVPTCFILLGGLCATIQLIGCFILFTPTELETEGIDSYINTTLNVSTQYYENQEIDSEFNSAYTRLFQSENESIISILKKRDFWILWFIFMLTGTVNVFSTTLYKTFGQLFIDSDFYLALVGSIGSIFNACGRIFWGQILDRFSYKIAIRTMTINTTIIIGTFYCIRLIPNQTTAEVMHMIWVCSLLANVCGIFAIMPAITAKLFGLKNVAMVYGTLFTANACAGMVGALSTSVLLNKITYLGIFEIGAGMTTIAFILTFLHSRKNI